MWDNLLMALAIATLPAPVEAPRPTSQIVSTVNLPIPEEYQIGETKVNVEFYHPLDVEWYCLDGAYNPDFFIYACYHDGRDVLILPNPCLYPEAEIVGSYAHLACHELAHKKGWRH